MATNSQINRNRLQAFSKLELIARQVVEGFITGLHKSPFHGFSVEFAEHRLYNNGESTRHIDWKLYGKTDKLFVKRYEEETNLRCQLVIDTSGSMFFPFPKKPSLETPNKMVFSVYAAAAIIEMLKRQRDAFGLSLIADELLLQTPARSNTAHEHLVFDKLESLFEIPVPEQRQSTRLGKALHQVADSIHKRSLVIIFSDMFEDTEHSDEIFSALQHLKHNKHEVIVFHTVDKKTEVDFDYQNRPYKFIDAESGEVLKLNPKDVKEAYVKQLQDYTRELKLRCGQYKIDFVEADINQGFAQILTPYLLKRKRMM
jgi:uncharacterized protein (DUF58 family)